MTASEGESAARGVARSTGALLISRVFELGAGLVVSLLVAGSLGVEGLGAYATGWAVYSLLVIAGQSGIKEYVLRELSRDPALTSVYGIHLSVLGVVAAGALSIAAVLIIQLLPYPAATGTAASVAALISIPKVLNVVQEAVFLAHGKARLEVGPRAIGFIAYVGSSALLLRAGFGVTAVFLAVLMIETSITLSYFILIRLRITKFNWMLDMALGRRLIRETRPYAASAALGALFSRPEVLILSVMSTQAEVGLYGAAVRVTDTILLLFDVLLSSAFAPLATAFERDESGFRRVQRTLTKVVVVSALPIATVLFAEAGAVLALAFGEEFRGGETILRVLCLNILVFSVFGILWRVLVARGRQDLNVRAQLMTVPLRLIGAVGLSAWLAGVGAAIAAVSAGIFHAAVLSRFVRRSGAELHLGLTLVPLLAASATSGLATWLGGLVLHPVAAGLLGLLTFVAFAILLRGISPADVRFAGKALAHRSASGLPDERSDGGSTKVAERSTVARGRRSR